MDARFLTKAVLSVGLETVPGSGLPSCDGRTVRFREDTVTSEYRRDPNSTSRSLAHSVLHCILGHSSRNTADSPQGLAEDMTVEYILDSLDTPHMSVPGRSERMYAFERLVSIAGSPSAEALAAVIASESDWKKGSYARLFVRDDHSGRGSDDDGWKDISAQAMAEVEGFARTLEGRTGMLLKVLRIRNRRRHDYRDFLRRFVTHGHIPKEDPDSFDPIYYTMGLRLYGNVPLMDSSETVDRESVEEFVVAIDTSGSTMKGPVIRFLEETVEVIRQCIPNGRSRIHVIQCDDLVRSDTVITDVHELSSLADGFELKGGGGTDFRPAFRYVDSLVECGELRRLRGMLYFTDGLGTFPEKRPGYDVAFVFCGDGSEEHPIPPWAMRVELDRNDLRTGE